MPGFAEVEWLVRTADVQVRVMTLAPGDGTPWHYHGRVADDVFGLDPGIQVAFRDPDEVRSIAPGERAHVAVRRVHRVVNTSAVAARYLLVQATGPYDFNEVT